MISALQYFSSYLSRSITVSPKKVHKILTILLKLLKDQLDELPTLAFDELNVMDFADRNAPQIYLFNTILEILAAYPQTKELLN